MKRGHIDQYKVKILQKCSNYMVSIFILGTKQVHIDFLSLEMNKSGASNIKWPYIVFWCVLEMLNSLYFGVNVNFKEFLEFRVWI